MKGKLDLVRSAALALLVTVAPARGLAQDVDVSGAWQVRWAQAIRVNRDGTVEVQRWGDASLTLSREGSRVTGTWTTYVLEEVNWPVTGTVEGGRLTLQATENDSTDPELDVVERLVWQATVSGDRIEGTVALWFSGMDREPGERPFTAVRSP